MVRISILALFLAVGVVSSAMAQEDMQEEKKEEKRLNRTFAQWKALFEANKTTRARTSILIVMGSFGGKHKDVLVTITGYMLDPKMDVQVRRMSVQVLGKMGKEAKKAIPAIMDVLTKAESEELRESAARALGGDLLPVVSAQEFPTLAKSLYDKHKGTRLAIAELFNEAGEKSRVVFDQILKAAKNDQPDPLTRMFLIKTLVQFPDNAPEYLPVLVTIADDKKADLGLRKLAVQELGRSAELFKKTEGIPKEILDQLTNKAGPVLIDIYKTTKSPKQTDPKLEDEAWTALRVASAVSLSKIGGDSEKIRQAARTNLSDELPAVRYQAVRLIGLFGKDNKETAGDLLKHAKFAEKDLEIRIAALQELAKLGSAVGEDVRAELRKLAENDNRGVIRKTAERTLKVIEGS